jgi:hypothetical protein
MCGPLSLYCASVNPRGAVIDHAAIFSSFAIPCDYSATNAGMQACNKSAVVRF